MFVIVDATYSDAPGNPRVLYDDYMLNVFEGQMSDDDIFRFTKPENGLIFATQLEAQKVTDAMTAHPLLGCSNPEIVPLTPDQIEIVNKRPTYRTKTIKIRVMVCKECDADMEEETNSDARTLYHWKCPECGWKH